MTGTAPSIDLRPDHWAIVRDVLRQYIPHRKVLAFGSRATWTAKDYSDLDLAILGDEALPLNIVSALAESFGKSDLPFKVDLVEWASIDHAFRHIVRRDGVDVQTLGDIPALATPLGDSVCTDWRSATIEEVSEKVAMGPFGSSIKVETFVPEGIPIVSGQHLHGTRVDDSPGYNFISEDHAARLDKANVQRGDVVFTHRGTIGQVAYVPMNSEFKRYVISQSQFFVRCKKSIAIPEFVTAYFKSPEGQHKLLANTSQVGVPSIAKPVTYLRKVEIPLPPLSEQRAIAHILSALDDKIDLNRRMNETLEAMARAIFKDWFIDFGPTRARMESREPYLPPELWDLFPDMLDSEGKPVGWEEEPVYAQAHWVNGAASKNMHFTDAPDALPVIKIAELKAGITKNTKFTNTALGDKFQIADGELLFSWSGNPDTSIDTFIWTGDGGWLNQHIFAVRENGKRSQPYLYAMLKWLKPEFAEIARNKQTTGLGHVTKQDLKRLLVPIGSPEVMTTFDELMKPIYDRILGNLMEMRVLAQIRDLLIPKLMSGEISLRDVEKATEAVA